MACLTDLSKAPEILYQILQYLSSAELFALLRTCKSLYPACYRELWSSLAFEHDRYRVMSNPYDPIVSTDRCEHLQRLIGTQDAQNLGFKYTKDLRLGSALFGDRSVNPKLNEQVRNLLEDGTLAPNTVFVRLDVRDLVAIYRHQEAGALSALKKYSETKSSKELAISLQVATVSSVPTLFDLEKITKYDLCIEYGWEGKGSWTADNRETGANIKELTTLLGRLVNLKHFSWATRGGIPHKFAISEFSVELGELQRVFDNMQNLKSLALNSYFLHPSFFLAPPITVRKLLYGSNLSPRWWRQFMGCPFIGVEELTICPPPRRRDFQMRDFLDPGEEDQSVKTVIVDDVAVTGLRKFAVRRPDVPKDGPLSSFVPGDMPVGLEECIIRRNPMLNEGVLRAIAEDRVRKLVGECSARVLERVRDCKPLLVDVYTSRFAEGDTGDPQQLTQDCLRNLLLPADLPQAGDRLRTLKASRELMKGYEGRVEYRLKSKLQECIDIVRGDYARRIAEGEDLDEASFGKACVKMFADWQDPGEAQRWRNGRSRAQVFMEICESKIQKKMADDCRALESQYKERILRGEVLETETTLNEWKWSMMRDLGEEDVEAELPAS